MQSIAQNRPARRRMTIASAAGKARYSCVFNMQSVLQFRNILRELFSRIFTSPQIERSQCTLGKTDQRPTIGGAGGGSLGGTYFTVDYIHHLVIHGVFYSIRHLMNGWDLARVPLYRIMSL